MKRMKYDWRARLGTPILSDLMSGSIETNDIGSYDHSRTSSLWAEHSRNPSYIRVESVKRSSNMKEKGLTTVVIDKDESVKDDVEVDESYSSSESESDSYSECESEDEPG